MAKKKKGRQEGQAQDLQEEGKAYAPERRRAHPGDVQQHPRDGFRCGRQRGGLGERRRDGLQRLAQGNAFRCTTSRQPSSSGRQSARLQNPRCPRKGTGLRPRIGNPSTTSLGDNRQIDPRRNPDPPQRLPPPQKTESIESNDFSNKHSVAEQEADGRWPMADG